MSIVSVLITLSFQMIPTEFRERHLPKEMWGAIELRLEGLPHVRYYVGLRSNTGTLYLFGGWRTFLERIRDGEGKLVLVFRYTGKNMCFVVQRFRSNGSMILKYPRPPIEMKLDPDGTIEISHVSYASDVWGPRGEPVSCSIDHC